MEPARPRRGLDPEFRERLLKLYAATRTIVVVGASADESKPANEIPAYLQSQGYRIIPVNPRGGVLFGERVFHSLDEVAAAGFEVDIVDVFRPAAEAPDIARGAVALGARVLWLQLGIESDEAREIAEAGGLTVVMNRCLGVMHQLVGLGPGPHSDAWRRAPDAITPR
ncbi:MAG: CoA-binding protein [Chloroflexi bacterium]|nr:CoA-binding protein [Chloroflexota bacterium]